MSYYEPLFYAAQVDMVCYVSGCVLPSGIARRCSAARMLGVRCQHPAWCVATCS